jgi:hypothetical protein
MFTDSSFWRGSLERALKTFAQTLAALIGANAVNVIDIDWPALAGISATAAVVSVLTSVASYNVGAAGPSLGFEEEL